MSLQFILSAIKNLISELISNRYNLGNEILIPLPIQPIELHSLNSSRLTKKEDEQ